MSVALQGSLLDTVDEVGLRTLGAAVRRVIREPGFRIAARSLGARMAADAAAQRGVAELEALAIRRAPD